MVLLRSLVPGKQEQSVTNKRVVNQVLVQHRVYYCEFISLASELCDPQLQSFSKTGTTQSRKKLQSPFYSILAERRPASVCLGAQSQTSSEGEEIHSNRKVKCSLFNVDLSGLMKWFSCESAPSSWSRPVLNLHFR